MNVQNSVTWSQRCTQKAISSLNPNPLWESCSSSTSCGTDSSKVKGQSIERSRQDAIDKVLIMGLRELFLCDLLRTGNFLSPTQISLCLTLGHGRSGFSETRQFYHRRAMLKLIIKITISSIVIGFKKLLFSTNSLANLLSDSSINESQSKL